MTDLRTVVDSKRAELEYAPQPAPTAGFGTVDRERVLAIIGLNPRDPKAHAVVAVAERYGLDPVLGHIQIISTSRMPYISRDGYLHIAHRSGQLDGIEVVDGPRREGAEWVATVAVWRKDMSRAFTYPGRAEVGRDNAPEMALARAERRALKRAFAVTPGALFADDEYDTAPRGIVEPPAVPAGTPAPQPDPDQAAAPAPEPPHAPPPATPSPEPAEADDETNLASREQLTAIHAAFRAVGITDRTERLTITRHVIGRQIASAKDLWRAEAGAVLDELAERRRRLDTADEDAALEAAYEADQTGSDDEPGTDD